MNFSKKSLTALAAPTALASSILMFSSLSASDIPGSISANVALTSDYYFRGLSQSNNNGAIQGGFDWAHNSGVYAGIWASNVSFGSTNIEADTYLGFKNEFSGFGYDLGWIKYNYNDTSGSNDPQEFYINLSYSFLSAGYAYSPDWFGTDEKSNYAYLGFEYSLPAEIGISASVGKSFGGAYKRSYGQNIEYVDYKIGINKDFAGINFELSYADNDLDSGKCASYGYTNKQCDGQIILSASKSIDDVSSKSNSELPISANVTLVTDYYFRGISQTNNDGAIQGGFDWVHESGFYAGLWASNVAFGATTLEADTYLGYANEAGDIGYDVGFIRYNYSETSGHSDPNEFYASLSYNILTAAYAYSPNWFGTSDDSNYLSLAIDYAMANNVGLSVGLGYSFGNAYDKKNGDGINDYDYQDYKIGMSKELAGITFDLNYIGNDLKTEQCTSYGYIKGNCGNRFILSATKSF